MDMMARPFPVICCMAAKFLCVKTRKHCRQRYLWRVTKTNCFLYLYSTNYLGWLFFNSKFLGWTQIVVIPKRNFKMTFIIKSFSSWTFLWDFGSKRDPLENSLNLIPEEVELEKLQNLSVNINEFFYLGLKFLFQKCD